MTDPRTRPPDTAATPDAGRRRVDAIAEALGTAAIVGAVIVLLNLGSLPVRLSLGQLIAAFLAINGALQAVRWARRGLRRRARRRLAREIVEYGGGLYGTAAVATYAYLHVLDLYGEIVDAGSLGAFLASITLGWLIAEAVEGFVFGIKAFLWPWYWFAGSGMQTAWLVAGGVWALDGARRPARRWVAAWRAARRPASPASATPAHGRVDAVAGLEQ